jgi:hypothetical protein
VGISKQNEKCSGKETNKKQRTERSKTEKI